MFTLTGTPDEATKEAVVRLDAPLSEVSHLVAAISTALHTVGPVPAKRETFISCGSFAVHALWVSEGCYQLSALYDFTARTDGPHSQFLFKVVTQPQPHRPVSPREAYASGATPTHALVALAAAHAEWDHNVVSITSMMRISAASLFGVSVTPSVTPSPEA